MKSEFKEYASKNNLSIEINIELMKYNNPSDSFSNFKSVVESLLKKSTEKFDMFIYSNRYTDIFAPYLLDLKGYLSDEYIHMYNSKVLKETCNHKEELIGLVKYFNINF